MTKLDKACKFLKDNVKELIAVRSREGKLSHKILAGEALFYLRGKVADPVLSGSGLEVRYIRLRFNYKKAMDILVDMFFSGRGGFRGEDNKTFTVSQGNYSLHMPHCKAYARGRA